MSIKLLSSYALLRIKLFRALSRIAPVYPVQPGAWRPALGSHYHDTPRLLSREDSFPWMYMDRWLELSRRLAHPDAPDAISFVHKDWLAILIAIGPRNGGLTLEPIAIFLMGDIVCRPLQLVQTVPRSYHVKSALESAARHQDDSQIWGSTAGSLLVPRHRLSLS